MSQHNQRNPLNNDREMNESNAPSSSSVRQLPRKRPRTTARMSIPKPRNTQPEPHAATPARQPTVQYARAKLSSHSWKFISKEELKAIQNDNYYSDAFIKALLPIIYSPAELLLPLKALPIEKKEEVFEIVIDIYGSCEEWEGHFILEMDTFRKNRRGAVYKKIGKDKGYGISSNGKEFYYLLSTGMCFKHQKCDTSDILQTKTIGDVAVPEMCGTFEYILLIKKNFSFADVEKLYSNGRIQNF